MILSSIGYYSVITGASGGPGIAMDDDSLTIENFSPGTKAKLLNMSALTTDQGYQQINAPSFSDTTRGIRCATRTESNGVVSPLYINQDLQETETLSVELAGTATGAEAEIGLANILYEDLPGRTGFYLNREQLRQQGVRAVTVYMTCPVSVLGNWGASELITVESNLLRTQRPYALIGANFNQDALAVGLKAPDWSNTRVTIPGSVSDTALTNEWFPRISDATGYPLIPVFNSGNKSSISAAICDRAAGRNTTVSFNLVELAGSPSDYNPKNMVLIS